MNIVYKCRCMAEEAEIAVPDRNDDECIVHWLRHICSSACALDHRQRSPRCHSEEIEYLKIPLDGGEDSSIGRITRQ